LRHQLERACRDHHPGNEQRSMIDLVDQVPDGEHRRHRPDPSRRDGQTRPGRIVPKRAFTQRRQKNDRRKHQGPDHEIIKYRCRKINVSKHFKSE